MRSVACLMLAANNVRNLARHTTQHLRICINYYPTLLYGSLVGVSCFIAIVIHLLIKCNSIQMHCPSKRDTKVISQYFKSKSSLDLKSQELRKSAKRCKKL